ncbi:hypothetical protein [uncultured Methanobrevibacter sp.]|uniref:hypothetical protein n=1 Tax=uncultured Methanobrevibacter sp. TaxID=253161 RepID=UPI00262AD919|nr:hypothetical protein [uncultured Methanobrevibacter sp.]
MKLKIGIIYGILIWFLVYLITILFNPLINNNIPYITIVAPISTIIVTGFFGILYIRNINENEVIEGFKIGIIFILIDIICDFVFFIIRGQKNILIEDYPTHIISMIILTLITTTLIGYMAQMEIDLK